MMADHAEAVMRPTVPTARFRVGTSLSLQYRGFLIHCLLTGAALVMLYPVIWLFVCSFKPQSDIFRPGGIVSTNFTWHNYVSGWNFFGDLTFRTFFINSFLICGLAVIGNVFSCSLAAYAFARLRFPLKKLWFSVMLGAIMLPIHADLIPQYVVFFKLGWVNTILPLVIPKFVATDAIYVFLMAQFMKTLPKELEQAAEIDGATFWQRYWLVIMPLARPALVTTAIFTFISSYNDYFSQLIYLSAYDKMTVPLALHMFIDSGGGASNFGGMFAMSILSLGPVIGFFLAGQKYLTQGIATSGFK
jgi:multiple sugar transport system permease protein